MIFEEDETRDGTESLIESDYESIEADESRIQKLEVEEAEDETQETDFDSLHFNFFEDSQSRSNSIQDGVISDDIFVHEDEMLSLVEDEI